MTMTLLVGLPASGKSTYAKEHFKDAIILNQDDLGSKAAVLYKAEQALRQKLDIVIDRCNMSIDQRSHFIKLAKKYNVPIDTLSFIISPSICKQRIRNRVGHPTVDQTMDWIVNRHMYENMKSDSTHPHKKEGIRDIKKLYWCKKHRNYQYPRCK